MSCTRTLYDIDDLEVADFNADVTKSVYTCSVAKRINGFSFDSGQGAILTSTSVITIVPPAEVQMSSAPLSGNFVIKCPDPTNPLIEHTSGSLGWWANRAEIEKQIDNGIPFATGRTYVREVGDSDEPYW